ncbi:MAG: hypothetical protein R2708_03895 [Vicinamibacterales bacterium]
MSPKDRKNHEIMVHRRTALSQLSSRWPVTSAAMQNANGTVSPTKPRYIVGGWMAM